MSDYLVIDTSLRYCYESSRFIGRLDDQEAAILVITLRSECLRLFCLVQVLEKLRNKIMSHAECVYATFLSNCAKRS